MPVKLGRLRAITGHRQPWSNGGDHEIRANGHGRADQFAIATGTVVLIAPTAGGLVMSLKITVM
jgi:hypothetical protein